MVCGLKALVIKIGRMDRELEEVYRDPKKAVPGAHTLYLRDGAELNEILSPKRIELIKYLIEHSSEKKSISELAKELRRKQEAVSRDASILEKYSLVSKKKERRAVHLKALYGSLKIELARS